MLDAQPPRIGFLILISASFVKGRKRYPRLHLAAKLTTQRTSRLRKLEFAEAKVGFGFCLAFGSGGERGEDHLDLGIDVGWFRWLKFEAGSRANSRLDGDGNGNPESKGLVSDAMQFNCLS